MNSTQRNVFYSNNCRDAPQGSTAAAMEGKLKEKLESMGLAFLCLSTGHILPFSHWCKCLRSQFVFRKDESFVFF